MSDMEPTLGDILESALLPKIARYEIVLGLTSDGMDLIVNRRIIETIKSFRRFSGLGLMDSMDIVQAIFDNLTKFPLNLASHEVYITMNADKYAAFMARWYNADNYNYSTDGFYLIRTGPFEPKPENKTKFSLS